MVYEPMRQRRLFRRLKGYDYAQAGVYFVTIYTQNRACVFGEMTDGAMCLNAAGRLAATLWSDMSVRFPEIDLDAFVIMPNHLHGVVVLSDGAAVRAPVMRAPGRPQGPPLRAGC
jgi:REP element-mobilizing transposase RayT